MPPLASGCECFSKLAEKEAESAPDNLEMLDYGNPFVGGFLETGRYAEMIRV